MVVKVRGDVRGKSIDIRPPQFVRDIIGDGMGIMVYGTDHSGLPVIRYLTRTIIISLEEARIHLWKIGDEYYLEPFMNFDEEPHPVVSGWKVWPRVVCIAPCMFTRVVKPRLDPLYNGISVEADLTPDFENPVKMWLDVRGGCRLSGGRLTEFPFHRPIYLRLIGGFNCAEFDMTVSAVARTYCVKPPNIVYRLGIKDYVVKVYNPEEPDRYLYLPLRSVISIGQTWLKYLNVGVRDRLIGRVIGHIKDLNEVPLVGKVIVKARGVTSLLIPRGYGSFIAQHFTKKVGVRYDKMYEGEIYQSDILLIEGLLPVKEEEIIEVKVVNTRALGRARS